MMLYLWVEANSKGKIKAEADLLVAYEIASTVGSHTIRVIAQHMARNAKSVEKTTSRWSAKAINVNSVPVDISQRKEKGKGFTRLMKKKKKI